jgi:Flp pilus assembly protein TadG
MTRRSARRAAASVELALLLPFLCFLFAAAVDYARIFYFALTVENSARNGAYFASNYPNASYVYNDIYGYTSLSDAVLRDAGNLIDPNNSSSAPTWTVGYSTSSTGPFTDTTSVAGGYVQLTVTWTFQSITSLPGIPSTVQLNRSCIMQVAPAMPTFPGSGGTAIGG